MFWCLGVLQIYISFLLLIFSDRVSTRHDAVAELDRMAGRKAPSFSQSVESSSNEDGTDNSSLKS